MAAIVSPWGKPGAWALDSEEKESELLKDHQNDQLKQQTEPTADFPSLSAAAATKPKKKKGQTVSLAEFASYGGAKPKPTEQKGLTHEDLMTLPTGPRQRSAEELDRSKLGGGFRNYGDDSSNSRWGSSRAFDESRKNGGGFGRESGREAAPSRADEIDNWAAAKKPMVGNGPERRERGWFSDSQASKADESESWVSSKSFVPSEGRRFSGTGGGFDRDRRGGFTSNGGGADSDSWGKKREESNGGSVSERPRLNLQPRSVPSSNGKPEDPGVVAKSKVSNPFGEARPREDILAEKGQDWKKIDEQLELMKIKGAAAEEDGKSDGTSFGKRSLGIGNGRTSDDRAERSWRKPETLEAHPESVQPTEKNGSGEEN